MRPIVISAKKSSDVPDADQTITNVAGKSFSFIKGIWPLLLLLIVGIITLRPAFKHAVSFALYYDNEYLIAAIFSHASNLIRSGHWPLWMNTIVGGVPLYNFPQFCLFYPFYFIFLPLYKNSPSAIYSLHYIVLLHIFLLQFSAYFLLQALRLSKLASVLGAVLFALSANTFVYCSWGNVLPAYPWLLLYLCALIHLYRQPHIKYVLLAIVSMVLLVMAAPAQPLIIAMLLTILFFGFQIIIAARQNGWRPFIRASLGLAVIGAVSMLLLAPIIVPIFLEYGQMIRYEPPFPAVIGYGKLDFGAFISDQMSLSDFLGVIFPIKEVRAVGSQFVGLFTLTLACLGLTSRRHRNYAIFFAIIAVYSLISAAGANLGFAYINYHIPLVNMIREPSKFLILFLLGASILAAIGFDHLHSRASEKHTRLLTRNELFILAALIVACAVALIWSKGHLVDPQKVVLTTAAWGVLLIFIWVSGATNLDKNIRRAVVLIFAGATLFVNFESVLWRPPSISTALYLAPKSIRLHSIFRHIAQLDPSHRYRVLVDGTLEKQQASMIGSFYGIRTFNVYSNPLPLGNMNEIYYYQPRTDKYLQAMGAKYLICDKCPAETVSRYNFRENIEGINIYETDDVTPYYYLKSQLDETYNDLNDYAVKTSAFILKDGILMAHPTDVPLLGISMVSSKQTASCLIFQEEPTPNKLAFALNCSAPHVFVLNEYYGGGQWKARVNGRNVFVAKINGNQVGVPVGIGGSYLEIEYSPRNLWKSFYPFFVGLFIFAGLVFHFIRS